MCVCVLNSRKRERERERDSERESERERERETDRKDLVSVYESEGGNYKTPDTVANERPRKRKKE